MRQNKINPFSGWSRVNYDDPPPGGHHLTILFQRTTATDSSCKLTGIGPWVTSLNNIYSILTNITLLILAASNYYFVLQIVFLDLFLKPNKTFFFFLRIPGDVINQEWSWIYLINTINNDPWLAAASWGSVICGGSATNAKCQIPGQPEILTNHIDQIWSIIS